MARHRGTKVPVRAGSTVLDAVVGAGGDLDLHRATTICRRGLATSMISQPISRTERELWWG